MRRALVLGILALACRAPTQATTTTPGKRAPAVERKRVELGDLADRLDVEGAQPLFADVPSWLASMWGVGTGVDPSSGALDLRNTWATWKDQRARADLPFEHKSQMLQSVLRAAASLEGALPRADAATRVDALLALAPVYAMLDAPRLVADRDLVDRATANVMLAFGSSYELVEPRSEELRTWAFATIGRAHATHRHALAELVRTAAGDPRLPPVLTESSIAIDTRASDVAIALARAGVELRGDEAEAVDWFALASACYRGLDPDGGDAALERAWKAGGADEPALAERIAAAVQDGTRARRVIAIGTTEALDPALERAELLVALQRSDDALAAYRALAAKHADDVRVAVGLARLHMSRSLDLAPAIAALDAVPRTSKAIDAGFLELAVAVRAGWLSDTVMAALERESLAAIVAEVQPELDKLVVDVDALEATGSDIGLVLGYVVDRGREALPAIVAGKTDRVVAVLRRVLPDAVAIAKRVPDSALAYRLVLAGTTFSSDRAATFAALADLPAFLRPPENTFGMPPQDARARELAALRFQRARAWIDAAIVWDDASQAELGMQQVFVDQNNTMEPSVLFTDARAVIARLQDQKDVWEELGQSFEGLSSSVQGDEPTRLLNNAGVAKLEAGKPDEARPLFEQALKVGGEGADLVRINLAAMGTKGIDLAPLVRSPHADVRWLALGVQHADARPADRSRLAAAMRAARAEHCRTAPRGRAMPGKAGIVQRAASRTSLGLASGGTLRVELETTSRAWLLVRKAYAAQLRSPCVVATGRRVEPRAARSVPDAAHGPM